MMFDLALVINPFFVPLDSFVASFCIAVFVDTTRATESFLANSFPVQLIWQHIYKSTIGASDQSREPHGNMYTECTAVKKLHTAVHVEKNSRHHPA